MRTLNTLMLCAALVPMNATTAELASDAPFSIEKEMSYQPTGLGQFYSRYMHVRITSKADSLTINDLIVNRGHCSYMTVPSESVHEFVRDVGVRRAARLRRVPRQRPQDCHQDV
jgi:hypothetical protein